MLKQANGIAFANPKGGSGKTTSRPCITGYMAKSIHTKSVLFLNKRSDPTVILDTVMAMAGV